MWRPCMDRNTRKGCGGQVKIYELDKSTIELLEIMLSDAKKDRPILNEDDFKK